ncbi:MAG: hypothetical protein IPI73_06845 [Betaproteobacteria bacterium]|nr:hypothetical protein [Betaproteobacteria bacterium]MBK8740086.1 hypothetical protein [Betaproteobacteria bacterium]
MPIRIFAGIVALVLVLGYLIPVVLKLKNIPLTAIILVGIAMMLVDLRQSLKAKDD